jgi:hypothetical protein
MKKLTPRQIDLLTTVSEYFYDSNNNTPWRSDYVVVRYSSMAGNSKNDIIFIPNFNGEDNFQFFTAYNCNAFPTDIKKIMSGIYEYRLARHLGFVYGQQMQYMQVENSITGQVESDFLDPFLYGINLITHPLHYILPIYSNISNHSRSSIQIERSAHSHLKSNLFSQNNPQFKLFVVDINEIT